MVKHCLIFVSIVMFQAIDADSTPQIQYKMLTGDITKFSIDSNGVIRTNVGLDYEAASFYQLTVTTVDGENSNIPSTTTTVQIQVLVSYYFLNDENSY